MTRDDCKMILQSLEIIRHFAEGGDVEFCFHDYTGKFLEWRPGRNSILISCLGRYKIAAKPHFKLTDDGIKRGKTRQHCIGGHDGETRQ